MDTKNLIGGEWTDSVAGLRADSIDPADGKVIGSFPDSSVEDARAAISAARDRFRDPNWAENPRLRQMAMLRWADALERQVNELARLLTRENGKTLGQSRGEIVGAISEVRYYAGLARVVAGRALEVEPGGFSTVLKEPAGVAAIIIPWNAPAVLLVRALAPALAAGCTAVIKPAPQAAQITAAMVRALHEVDGLPEGVVNLVTETGSGVAQEFVASREVAVVSFTGSSQTGQRIMAAAAPTMKKLSLELGGKSCALVFPDADVPRVASLLARAAVIISGQQCTAARRVLVHASRYDAMKAALKEALGAMVVAPGTRPGADMGPLIDQSALAHVTSRIEQTMDECDEVILRGARLGGDLSGGFFVSPTLVAHRDTSAFFCQEEIFGPLVVVERFDDEREAVARANHTEFGLSASVWTNDGARALRVARALHDGTVWINDHNKLFAEAEAGGYLRSGLGRLHGYEALMDFLEVKHIYQSVGVVQADSV